MWICVKLLVDVHLSTNQVVAPDLEMYRNFLILQTAHSYNKLVYLYFQYKNCLCTPEEVDNITIAYQYYSWLHNFMLYIIELWHDTVICSGGSDCIWNAMVQVVSIQGFWRCHHVIKGLPHEMGRANGKRNGNINCI